MTAVRKLKSGARAIFLSLLLVLVAACVPALDGSDTGPVPGEETCDTTVTGDHEITTGGTAETQLVIDGLCVVDGTLIIDADYVTVQNGQFTSSPGTGSPYPIFVDDGHHGIRVTDSNLTCGGLAPDGASQEIGILAESGAKQTDPALAGLYLDVQRNEVRNCTDGFQLASNSYYASNLIADPDHEDGAHEDGIQFSTEDDGVTGIHDTRVTLNRIHFPDSSASFQYHNRIPTGLPSEWPTRIEVDHNVFQGGVAVIRFPGRGGCPATECSGVGLKFYANEVGRLTANESYLCDGDTSAVAVWGAETGNPDDANVNLETGGTLERAC